VSFHHSIATSAAISFVVALAGAIGFVGAGLLEPGLPPWSVGYVYVPAFVGISLTSIFLAPVGARVAHRMPVATLKKVFAVFLLILATKLALSL
jgi:uncharacterized membrane protein YfcA